MASKYAATAQRALATIARKGAPVTFTGSPASAPVLDEATGQWSGGSGPSADVIGRAIQIEGDPDRFKALNLVLVNPVTLMIAAKGLPVGVIAPGKPMRWAGVDYTIRDAGDTLAPDGEPILYFPTGTV
jgi:hypothetical protein